VGRCARMKHVVSTSDIRPFRGILASYFMNEVGFLRQHVVTGLQPGASARHVTNPRASFRGPNGLTWQYIMTSLCPVDSQPRVRTQRQIDRYTCCAGSVEAESSCRVHLHARIDSLID
jgi:hypothetical protein